MAADEKRVFKASRHFEVPTLNGKKRFVVRFPSDEEWCDRARRRKIIKRHLGRGMSKYEPGNGGAIDLELLRKILVEDADATESEATFVLNWLESAEVSEVEKIGSQYKVPLRVAGANVVITLETPDQADLEEFETGSGSIVNGATFDVIRIFLDPATRLYDKCSPQVQGYEGPVPITHKNAALGAMIAAMKQAFADQTDPED